MLGFAHICEHVPIAYDYMLIHGSIRGVYTTFGKKNFFLILTFQLDVTQSKMVSGNYLKQFSPYNYGDSGCFLGTTQYRGIVIVETRIFLSDICFLA